MADSPGYWLSDSEVMTQRDQFDIFDLVVIVRVVNLRFAEIMMSVLNIWSSRVHCGEKFILICKVVYIRV